jgi:regulator of telomere elongation helicase 1
VQKQEYLDLKCREEPNLELNGERWYKIKASRTVNQAIGQVIRHIRDFGAVFLCDQRYSSQSTIGISKWMRDRKRVFDAKNIGHLEPEVVNFFRDNIAPFGTKAPAPVENPEGA